MKKKLILITALMTMMGMIPSFAQQYAPAIAKKLSISTQMFLKKRAIKSPVTSHALGHFDAQQAKAARNQAGHGL